MKIENSEILVDFVRSGIQDLWKPRRLGGGYGGKIKSSQITVKIVLKLKYY